jgi:Uma2 family endonuclease
MRLQIEDLGLQIFTGKFCDLDELGAEQKLQHAASDRCVSECFREERFVPVLTAHGRGHSEGGDNMAYRMETRSLDAGTDIHRRLFTVDEYYRMAEAGILGEDDRVELLDGEIVEMSPIGSVHAACVDRLITALYPFLEDRGILRVQNPVRLDRYSEPQPDAAILKPRADFYATAHPTPADVLLVIEVADSSLKFDRQVKLMHYSRAGIAEVWLVDLVNERVELFTQPSPDGYRKSVLAHRGERLSSAALGSAAILIDDIIGERKQI